MALSEKGEQLKQLGLTDILWFRLCHALGLLLSSSGFATTLFFVLPFLCSQRRLEVAIELLPESSEEDRGTLKALQSAVENQVGGTRRNLRQMCCAATCPMTRA